MQIYNLIDDETKRKLNAVKPVVHRQKRNKEKLSKRDVEELMGVNRDTYKRVNGKVRRK
ncbi:MAG: hypothetical protein ABS882_03550 [Lysinibacillus sp.]